MGNVKSNAIFNPDEIRNPPPTNMIEQERDSDLEKYIRGKFNSRRLTIYFNDHSLAKYEFRKFFDKRGVVVAKLGPSRSRDSLVRRQSPQQPEKPSTTRSPSPLVPRRTVQQSSPQPTLNLPPRPTSAVVQPTQTPVKPAVPRPASVWDDLTSLNASLPLQYVANPTPSQPLTQQATNLNLTNPYANLVATPGVQPQLSPFSQPLPLQQNPATSFQIPSFNSGLQPSFGGNPGLLSIPHSQSTQQFNTGATFGVGPNSMNSLQSFSTPAFPNQTFLPQQTQSFQAQQFQQPGGGMPSTTFPGQMQNFQPFTPNASGNPFFAMQQQQQLQQAQPTGYVPQQQQTFGASATNPFGQMMQPGTPFVTVQTQGWQNAGFPAQQQPWG